MEINGIKNNHIEIYRNMINKENVKIYGNLKNNMETYRTNKQVWKYMELYRNTCKYIDNQFSNIDNVGIYGHLQNNMKTCRNN